VSDDESFIPHHDDEPAGARTPFTPPVADSPPPFPRPQRQRLIARLRPISIPDMVSDFAGKDAIRAMSVFESRYMPANMPSGDASARGNADSHRADLKRKSDGISRSLSEVFAYLTYGTESLDEAKKLLTIITNVCTIYILYFKYHIIQLMHIIVIIEII
jgi:hypothetical protein